MTKQPRIAIAGIFIESNAFCPPFHFTPQEASSLFTGKEILTDARSEAPRVHKELSGFVRRMDERMDWSPVPILYGGLKPCGPVDQGKVEAFLDQIFAGLAETAPLDAVYISTHGAMTATGDEDIEGTIAARIREVVGAIPIVTTFDLHGNISQRHVDSLDLAVSYREDPHYDQYRTGVECADGLIEILSGAQTMLANLRLPIVPPNVSLGTEDGPYGEVIAVGQKMMDERIMNVSVLAGFAYSDTSKNGIHVIVTSRRSKDPDGTRAAEIAQAVAEAAWERKERFDWNLTSTDDAVEAAVRAGEDSSLPPIFLVDLGDNAGAGGTARSLWMFRSLHEAGAKDALIGCFFDPDLVAQADKAGLGAQFDAVLTGDDWGGGPARYETRAEVLALADGHCTARTGIAAGRSLNSGRSCLLRCGPTLIVANSRHTTMNDPAYVEILGIRPGSFRSIVLKGRGSSYLRAWGDYFPPGHENLSVDSPGRTSPILDRFDWTRLPRPVWPVDRDADWTSREPAVQPGAAFR